jgi:hypothetical protein
LTDGTLFLFDNAEISIKNNSVFEISGKLEVENNCTINIESGSYAQFDGEIKIKEGYSLTIEGDGYVILNGNIMCGPGATLTIEGAGTSTKLLEVQKSISFDSDFASVTIRNGKIVMNNTYSELLLNSGIANITIDNVLVTSADGINNNGHEGIDIRSNGTVSISNSTFEQGYYGLYASRAATSPNLTVTNCTFNNNSYGLRVYNGGVDMDDCTAEYNTVRGIYCNSMDKASTINNSTVRYQNGSGDYGVYFEGSATANLSMNSNAFNNNYYGLYLSGAFQASLKCSSVANNTDKGIMVANNNNLYLAGASGISAGNNDLHGNKYALYGTGVTQIFNSLYLKNGSNDLRDNGTSGSYCIGGQFGAHCGMLTANNNYWKTGGGAPVNNTDYLVYAGCLNLETGEYDRLLFSDISPESSYQSCTQLEEPTPGLLAVTSSFAPLAESYDYREVSTDMGEQPLNEAINTILNTDTTLREVYDLDTRFALLGEVLENDFTDMNPAEAWYMKHAYKHFKSALGKFDNQKDANKVDEKLTRKMQKVIRKLIKEQQKTEGRLSTYSSELMAYFIDEANTLWYAGNYDEAIALLQSAADKANADWTCEIKKMICQIQVDQAFIESNNTLDIDQALLVCEECNGTEKSGSLTPDNSEGSILEQVNPAGLMEIKLSINPHPVNQASQITVLSPGKAMLVIYNSTGQLVSKQNIAAGITTQTVSNSHYAPGIYLVTVLVDGQTRQSQKMVVTK